MKQGLGITVKGFVFGWVITLWLIVQSQEESSRLYCIQRFFIYSLAEKLMPGLGPRDSKSDNKPVYLSILNELFAGLYVAVLCTCFLPLEQLVSVLLAVV